MTEMAEDLPKEKLELAPLPTLEEALAWKGRRVDDWSGKGLGKVTGIHVDAEDRGPKWVIIRMGLFAGEAAVPFEHVAAAAGRLWAAYEKEAMRSSPKLSAGQTLNARQELQLCEHYGIRGSVGRAGEISERPEDEPSAVPAS